MNPGDRWFQVKFDEVKAFNLYAPTLTEAFLQTALYFRDETADLDEELPDWVAIVAMDTDQEFGFSLSHFFDDGPGTLAKLAQLESRSLDEVVSGHGCVSPIA